MLMVGGGMEEAVVVSVILVEVDGLVLALNFLLEMEEVDPLSQCMF
jgi:hypothetical protein